MPPPSCRTGGDRVIVTFLCPSAPYPVGGVTALYEFANGLSRRGHRVHLLHADFFRHRIDSIEDLAWFPFEPGIEHHLIEAGDPSAIPDADVYFGQPVEPKHGQPVVLIQGYEMLHLGLEQEAFRTPCLKVCVASWLAEVGTRFGAHPEQFEVVPMGIDHGRFRVVRAIPGRAEQIGMLMSTHPAKGFETGLRALEIVREQRPSVRVLLFGTSQPKQPLPDWATFVLEPDPQHLVEQVYNESSVFVQSSDYEGFGFTAVEAMACGAALVTTDNGGSRDYAIHDETALVSAPGDAKALASHVVDLLDDDARRVRLAQAGQAYVQRFDWDEAAVNLESSLLRYLADPAAYQRPPGPKPAAHVGRDPFSLR